MSIYAKLVIAVLVFALGFAAGVRWMKGEQAIADRAAYKEAEAMRAKRESIAANAATKHEADRERIRINKAAADKEVKHVTQSEFYSPPAPACIDDVGMFVIRRAFGVAEPASQPAPAVPSP